MLEVEAGGVEPVVALEEMVELANIAGVMPSGRGRSCGEYSYRISGALAQFPHSIDSNDTPGSFVG